MGPPSDFARKGLLLLCSGCGGQRRQGEAEKRTNGERLFALPRLSAAAMEVLADHRQRIRCPIERLHGAFERRVKTQCARPNAEAAAMLFWALMASGQITMRRLIPRSVDTDP